MGSTGEQYSDTILLVAERAFRASGYCLLGVLERTSAERNCPEEFLSPK